MIERNGLKHSFRSLPLLGIMNLLFFLVEFALGIALRSAALFADGLGFLEAATLCVLSAPGLGFTASGREALGRFAGTLLLIPTCFIFWMAWANYQLGSTALPMPMAVTGAFLLLINVSGLFALRWPTDAPMGILLVLRSPTAASAAIILASLLTWASDSMWPDTVVAIYILWMNASAAQSILYAAERPASSNR